MVKNEPQPGAFSKINIACGEDLIEGWLNCDKFKPKNTGMEELNGSFFQFDMLDFPWPFAPNSFESARFYHAIEHLPWQTHDSVLYEIHKILKPDGILTIAYPEFEVCVKNFLDDKNGQKYGFWLRCLYGEQTAPGMFHLAPVERRRMEAQLRSAGFFIKSYMLTDDFNGEIVCVKTK